ncbi:MAG: prepilin-type N-terminal cleavage/methylation domain-containing protein [Candidatus Omnitrophota bacterium]
MKKQAFTLIELVLVVVVLGILATIAIPTYENIIADSESRVCQTNLEALDNALDIYVMSHDVMPGSLSELTPQDIQKAYAHILQQKGAWRVRLAYYIIGWKQRGLAYASLLSDIAEGNLKLITCPSDDTPPPAGVSYGLNSILKNMNNKNYRDIPGDTAIIGDCQTSEFTEETTLEARHEKQSILTLTKETSAKVITKNKKVEKMKIGKKSIFNR